MKILIAPFFVLLTACGSSSDHAPAPAPVQPADYSGAYDLGFESTTPLSTTGAACASLLVDAVIEDSTITATFLDAYGVAWWAIGDVLTDGTIEGVIFEANAIVGYFSGDIENGGDFEDIYGCKGAWLVRLKP